MYIYINTNMHNCADIDIHIFYKHTHIHTHMYIHIYTHIYIYALGHVSCIINQMIRQYGSCNRAL